MNPSDNVPVMRVKSSEHDGAEVTINKSDFNPDIHTEVKSKKAKEMIDEVNGKPIKAGVTPDVDILPPGAAGGGQAQSREDTIKKIEEEDPEKAKAIRAADRDPVKANLGKEDDDEDDEDEEVPATRGKGAAKAAKGSTKKKDD